MTPALIEQQLHLWPGLEGGQAVLINLSENHTFRITTPDGAQHIIRVHRPGYQTHEAIQSELNWLTALREDTNIPVVEPCPGVDGEIIQAVTSDGEGRQTFAVRFRFEQGEIAETLPELKGFFARLGQLAALCHTHVENWRTPEGFSRPTWDVGAILNPDGLWGDWRQAPNVTGDISTMLTRLDTRLRADFSVYGATSDRFGLIHADMRLANLLVHGDHVRLIDFDDCGFGWYAYDFGAAVSFFEDSPELPQLKAEWLEAYRQVRPFSSEDENMLEAAVLLRRMALLAWVGSHHEVELARHHAPDFAQNTASLADAYLSRNG
jgi:Ser/Thr protein kinase RdoA (MazF antagonist)